MVSVPIFCKVYRQSIGLPKGQQRSGLDRDPGGVNVRIHEVSERVVHQAVLGKTAEATEAGGGDTHVEVAPSVPRTGMAGVKMTLVDYFQQPGIQRCRQAFPDRSDPRTRCVAGHGKT